MNISKLKILWLNNTEFHEKGYVRFFAVACGQKDIKLIGAFFKIVSRTLERFLIHMLGTYKNGNGSMLQ
jgi:hypothetical protein